MDAPAAAEEAAEPLAPAPAEDGPARTRRCVLCPEGKLPLSAGNLGSLIGPFNTGSGAYESCYVHSTCAEWSPEVYWEADELCEVVKAVRRGRKMTCTHCGGKGATLGCLVASCRCSYHYACARAGRAQARPTLYASLRHCRPCARRRADAWLDTRSQLDTQRFLAACPAHARADAFRYAAGPSAAPPSAAAAALDPLLASLERRSEAGAQAALLAEPLLRRLACLGERGLHAARMLTLTLKAMADEANPPPPSKAAQRAAAAAAAAAAAEEAAREPEVPDCLTKDMIEALYLKHTGKDISRQKLAKRKVAAMLPAEVIEAAAAEVMAAQAAEQAAAAAMDEGGAAADAPPAPAPRPVPAAPPAAPPPMTLTERIRSVLDSAARVAASLEGARPTPAAERPAERAARVAAPLLRSLDRLGEAGKEAAAAVATPLLRIARYGEAGAAAARGIVAAMVALASGPVARVAEGRHRADNAAAVAAEEEEINRLRESLPGLNAEEVRLPIVCNGVEAMLVIPARFQAKEERVEYGGDLHVGSSFEAMCGLGAHRKWRHSCRVLLPGGEAGETVGEWMEANVEPDAASVARQRARERAVREWRDQLRVLLDAAERAAEAFSAAGADSSDDEEHFARREAKRVKKYRAAVAPRAMGGNAPTAAAAAQAAAQAAAAASASAGGAGGWEGLAGCAHTVRALKELTLLPLLYPEAFAAIGAASPRGVLLHGPPGCGKTQAVRALVGAAASLRTPVAFFSRRGADCLGKYSGEAERTLRLLFEEATAAAPSIIFFDELDGLAPARGAGRAGAQDAIHASVVATLLALMDGLHGRGQVVIVGATNRPDSIDPALRRPGRFDRELHFPLPGPATRDAILKLATRRWEAAPSARLRAALAAATEGYAGADLRALATAAVLRATRRAAPGLLRGDVMPTRRDGEAGPSAAAQAGDGDELPQPPSAVQLVARIRVRPRDWLAALADAPAPCSRRSAALALAPSVAPVPHHLARHVAPTLAAALAALRRLGVRLPPVAAAAVAQLSGCGAGAAPVELEAALVRAGAARAPPGDAAALLRRASGAAAAAAAELAEAAEDAVSEGDGDDVSDEEDSAWAAALDLGPPSALPASLRLGGAPGASLRLLLCGVGEQGQSAACAALLHALSGWTLHSVSLPALLADGGGAEAEGAARALREPLRQARLGPLVLHLPAVDAWARASEQEQEGPASAAWSALCQALPAQAGPAFVLVATSRTPAHLLPQEVRDCFQGGVILEVQPPDADAAAELRARIEPWADEEARAAATSAPLAQLIHSLHR